MSKILELRECLLRLLDRVANKESLQAELSRARREFFDAEQPDYAKDEQALELAAIRFAEWFLLERCHEQLGEIPILLIIAEEKLRDQPAEDLELLDDMACSRVGVFISEAIQGDRVQIRDLQGGERLELAELPEFPDPGDILVGRMYEHGGGAWLASVAMAILPASPEIAVAYQKDLRQLNLERRLTQSELEHLLFRRWAENRHSTEKQVPLEHLEAELDILLSSSGLAETYPVAEISRALQGLNNPGAVIGPILDELAFDSDVDLEQLRRLMNEIWSCRARGQQAADKTVPAAKPAATDSVAEDSVAEDGVAKDGVAKDSDELGERVAARLQQGLAKHEDLEVLFQKLAGMVGAGSLDDVDDGESVAVDAGDLEPLLREFAWEEGLEPTQEATLTKFLRSVLEAPIPKNLVEYLDRDDLLRFLLGSWLGSAPAARVSAVREHAELLRRFFVWVQDTQSMEVSELAEMPENPLLSEAERLDLAGQALSTSDRPETCAAEPVQLMRVTEVREKRLSLLLDQSRREVGAIIPSRASAYLRQDDLMFARFADSGGRGKILGMVVVVPGELHHLLG